MTLSGLPKTPAACLAGMGLWLSVLLVAPSGCASQDVPPGSGGNQDMTTGVGGNGGHGGSGGGGGIGGGGGVGGGGGSGGSGGSGGGGGIGGGGGGGGGGGSGGSGGGGGGGGSGGSGGGGGGGGSCPFGSHAFQYPADVLHPTGAQADLDSKTAAAYDTWKSKYVKQGCGGYYVLSGGGTGKGVGDEVSEGHGYGMVITALMAGHDPEAQTIFDGMYNFFHMFPTTSHQNLMAWTVNVAGGCQIPAMQGDSATDGDLDIAFALLLAERQWPGNGYLQKAQAVIADLKSGDMHMTTHEPLLGDWATPTDPQYNATRPSDFMLDHFRAFGPASGDAAWTQSVDAVYQLIDTMQTSFAPSTGLLPDFIINTTSSPTPANANFLEGPADGQYGYNSCRVPWRISTDYIAGADARAKTAVQKIDTWIMGATNNDPSKILDGYTLAGGKGAGQTGPSSAFSSPFGVAAMLGTDQAWLDAIWASRAINEDYYSDSITMLCMLVMSGNWCAP
jgi:endo-1,4-beta-D-glucanase Y